MFHNCPMWMFFPILGFIICLVFAIPIYDWLKGRNKQAILLCKRYIRYDGLIATDITITNKGKKALILREIGTYSGSTKQPVEQNLAIEILPEGIYKASYLNAQESWYALVEQVNGKMIQLP